ncbi:hypothetical protein [Frederiksenia canicola]|uniref:hypothetical protein n=1 Tax=Frederiksenia canicola TaxID=123824 RepID=UPI001404C672|nr:hypothetical protein [Frederiksenia canicola]
MTSKVKVVNQQFPDSHTTSQRSSSLIQTLKVPLSRTSDLIFSEFCGIGKENRLKLLRIAINKLILIAIFY